MSLDGFVAGNDMTLEKPFGDIQPERLMKWMFDEPDKHKDEIVKKEFHASARLPLALVELDLIRLARGIPKPDAVDRTVGAS